MLAWVLEDVDVMKAWWVSRHVRVEAWRRCSSATNGRCELVELRTWELLLLLAAALRNLHLRQIRVSTHATVWPNSRRKLWRLWWLRRTLLKLAAHGLLLLLKKDRFVVEARRRRALRCSALWHVWHALHGTLIWTALVWLGEVAHQLFLEHSSSLLRRTGLRRMRLGRHRRAVLVLKQALQVCLSHGTIVWKSLLRWWPRACALLCA